MGSSALRLLTLTATPQQAVTRLRLLLAAQSGPEGNLLPAGLGHVMIQLTRSGRCARLHTASQF